ncbi:MAG: hypothetical protein JSR98_19530 [Proteobacteria bacterium]|nr:hypothetical protein [Pseudomonadota bacterium]
MRTVLAATVLAFALAGQGTGQALADPAADSAQAWRTLTRADVEAHYHLLKENHPGAAAEAEDPGFVTKLEAARTQALARAGKVDGVFGYIATVAGFAHAFGDSHINNGPVIQPRTVSWPGIVAARRGEGWVVAADEPKVTGREVVGAEIVSCDGRPFGELARDALAFHGDAASPAEQILFGNWTLVDDHNPFLALPKSCLLRKDGVETTLPLKWTSIAYTTLRQQYWKAPVGHAGFGVRRVGDGWWISIEHLDAGAQPVIAEVKAKVEQIRDGAFVVVDLRGNGGGNDAYGVQLAQALMGEGYVDDVLGPQTGGDCETRFRASAENAAALTKAAAAFARTGDKAGQEGYERGAREIAAARAKGKALTGPPRCSSPPKPPLTHASLAKAPIVLLTDVACFSSCIQMSQFFRDLGATHVGQITGADTHYSEYRDIVLPSGLSSGSTLMGLMPDAPPRLGPYAPKYPYAGDIADTAGLERWIVGEIVPKLQMQRAAARE